MKQEMFADGERTNGETHEKRRLPCPKFTQQDDFVHGFPVWKRMSSKNGAILSVIAANFGRSILSLCAQKKENKNSPSIKKRKAKKSGNESCGKWTLVTDDFNTIQWDVENDESA